MTLGHPSGTPIHADNTQHINPPETQSEVWDAGCPPRVSGAWQMRPVPTGPACCPSCSAQPLVRVSSWHRRSGPAEPLTCTSLPAKASKALPEAGGGSPPFPKLGS